MSYKMAMKHIDRLRTDPEVDPHGRFGLSLTEKEFNQMGDISIFDGGHYTEAMHAARASDSFVLEQTNLHSNWPTIRLYAGLSDSAKTTLCIEGHSMAALHQV